MDHLFKWFFGTRRDPRRDISRENEWEDLDDDDGNHGEFFFHFDLHRQMESMQREMEDMFRNFGAVEFFPDSHDQHKEFKTPKNPRDEMLKDENKKDSNPYFVQPRQPFQPFNSPFGTPFGIPVQPRIPIEEKKVDTDLDGKLSVDDVTKLLDKPPSEPRSNLQSSTSFGKTYSYIYSQGSGGKVEKKKTVRDANGNEEVTVTRSLGDQSHSVTIKKDKSGSEEKIENFKNMDEGDLDKFNKSWDSPTEQAPSSDQMLKEDNPAATDKFDARLFDNFFGSWFKSK